MEAPRRTMDYDKTTLATNYDAGRDFDASAKRKSLGYFAANVPAGEVTNVMDVGCGTGRFSTTLADIFDANVVGVEPSKNMLEQAHAKHQGERLRFVSGSAEALPADNGSLDLVFMSMVVHHLENPDAVARECHRVLRNGGFVCIRNTVSEEDLTFPYLPFFPSVGEIIQTQLPSRARLDVVFEGAGFVPAGHECLTHEVAANWEEYADKISMKADSFIAQLTDQEFEAGLEAMRLHARTADPDQNVEVDVHMFTYRKAPAHQ